MEGLGIKAERTRRGEDSNAERWNQEYGEI
jgi:hypothetical protein